MSSWNPDADFYFGMMRRHGGLVRITARRLMLKSLRDGLRGSNQPGEHPGSWRTGATPAGRLGQYEAARACLQNDALRPAEYERACLQAARRVRV